MRVFTLPLLIFLSFSNVEARDFLRSKFTLDASYQDLEGNKFDSGIEGRIRVSSDGVFCAIDVPALGNTYPCQVKDWSRTSYGVLVPRAELFKMYKSMLITVNPWPQPVLERFDLLVRQIRFQSVGNYPGYASSHAQQLHDKVKADSLHVYMSGGGGWVIY